MTRSGDGGGPRLAAGAAGRADLHPVLAVSVAPADLARLPRNLLTRNARRVRVRFDDLGPGRLSGPTAPQLVLSPLVTPRFDALDLACLLVECGYRGRFLALADHLPDPALIRREIQAQCSHIRCDVVLLNAPPPVRPV